MEHNDSFVGLLVADARDKVVVDGEECHVATCVIDYEIEWTHGEMTVPPEGSRGGAQNRCD